MEAPSNETHQEVLDDFTKFVDGATVLVVTVSYKSAALVVNSLAALEGETREVPGLRVAVVNNSCGMDAAEIRAAIRQRGWERFVMLLVSPKNGGYAYGNNVAVRAALKARVAPQYFWLLNPDAQACPGATQALITHLDQNPKVGIAGSQLVNPDGSVWPFAFRFPTLISEFERGARLGILTKALQRHVAVRQMGESPERVDWLPGASMLIRRAVFEDCGLMDEGYFLYHEETDFCLQAQKAGWECWYLPASRVMHIAGQSTGVTNRDGQPKRRPEYVFDSRRRFFVKNHGWPYAVLADLAWSVGFASWRVRFRLQGRSDPDPPHLLWDSLRHSALVRGPRI